MNTANCSVPSASVFRPAATAAGSPPVVTSASAPSPPSPPPIKIGDDGRVQGVDGMLDQIASAFSRHAGPMLVRDVLPAVREDTGLQSRVSTMVGTAIANEVRPYLIIGAGSLALIALFEFLRWKKGT